MFHFSHKWKAVSAQSGKYADGKGDATLFSEVCHCGEWRIRIEEGKWLLQDGVPVTTLRLDPDVVLPEPVN